jgi:tetratricopeptide (TPR) repeat protein
VEPPAQSAQGYGIAQALGPNAKATLTIIGLTPEQLQQALRAAGAAQQAAIDDLSKQFDTTREAVRGFFKILSASEVPVEKLPRMLEEIAQRHRAMLQRLAALDPDTAEIKSYIEQARAILSGAETPEAYDRADTLLAEAEASDMRAIRDAESLEREAREAATRKRRSAAATRAERGDLSLTRLDYLQAGQHFKAAAELVGHYEPGLRAEYLNRYASALCEYGDYRGDNAVLAQAIAVNRLALAEIRREELSLTWATIQNNLGNALGMLGGRESGTGRLKEAVAAYHEALKERTRERVPLDWAMTQNNLGAALGALGERESGTVRLEEAVTAYREALKEYTRERVPLQWATMRPAK